MAEPARATPEGAPAASRQVPRWRRLAAYIAIALVLAAVFAAYLNPHLAVDLASRFWACF